MIGIILITLEALMMMEIGSKSSGTSITVWEWALKLIVRSLRSYVRLVADIPLTSRSDNGRSSTIQMKGAILIMKLLSGLWRTLREIYHRWLREAE